MADADELNAIEFAHLTTTGRSTRRPHTVELWFWCERDRIWFLGGIDPPIVDGHPDWLRNLAEDPDVTVRVGEHEFRGSAAIIDNADGSAEARREIAKRYMGWQGDEPLPKWQREGIAVLVTRR